MGFASGTGIKILSAFFRLMQLISAVIVTGIVGRYLNFAHNAHAHAGSRLIYAEVLGGISILAALLLFFPWKGSFWAFPFDIIMFIMWIVAFGLLAALSSSCGSSWYRTTWNPLWGGFWRSVPVSNNTVIVSGNFCGRWRSVLAFAFIGAMFWLFSACLGLFKSTQREDNEHRYRRTEKVTETTHPVVSPPVVNRTNETTTQGGPAYGANANNFGATNVREPGYVANNANVRSPGYGVNGDNVESTLGTARGTGAGATRDPTYAV